MPPLRREEAVHEHEGRLRNEADPDGVEGLSVRVYPW